MARIVNPAVSTGTGIAPLGAVSSSGAAENYAAIDHAHVGVQRIAFGGNTEGQSKNLAAGQLVIAGGTNVTLSGSSSVLSIHAQQTPLTTVSYMAGAQEGWIYRQGAAQNSYYSSGWSSAITLWPLRFTAQLTVNSVKPFMFVNSLAPASTSIAHTFSVGMYSFATSISSYVLMGSASYSDGWTTGGNNNQIARPRTTSMGFNASMVLSMGVDYYIAFAGSMSNDAGTSSTNRTACGPAITLGVPSPLLWDTTPWGISKDSSSLSYGQPHFDVGGITTVSSTAFPASISYVSSKTHANGFCFVMGLA